MQHMVNKKLKAIFKGGDYKWGVTFCDVFIIHVLPNNSSPYLILINWSDMQVEFQCIFVKVGLCKCHILQIVLSWLSESQYIMLKKQTNIRGNYNLKF